MIIDSHAHIGKHGEVIMKVEHILYSMEKYGVNFTLIADATGEEFDGNQNLLNTDNQLTFNKKMIKRLKEYPKKLGALLWLKPYHEEVTSDLIKLIEEERDYIYALKFHPYHSQLPFDDPKMYPYIELAEKFDLPVVTHTASSYESSPRLVYNMAKKYPKIKFVMVHMGLGTDNNEAIELISKLDNLYGDTTWVTYKNTIKAINICGSDKILFGTDNPIDGPETLGKEFYQDYFTTLKDSITKEQYEQLMFKNAQRLFKIPIK